MDHTSASSPVVSPTTSCDAWGSAPGRVEFIGNHTDYNGGWVLGATIDRRVDVAITRREDRELHLESQAEVPSVQLSLDDEPTRLEGEHGWANYIIGVIRVLRDEGFALSTGLDIRVESTLPVGAGLSSSAALELASATALSELFEWGLGRRKLAQLSRKAENDFVGVPCGILDQAVVAFGDENRLVRIDAQTEEIDTVPFPSETNLWIFRTHEAHSLAEAHYQERYDESRDVRDRLDELLGGVEHLAEVSPEQLEQVREDLPDLLYRRARHVTTEHRRVQSAVQRLEEGDYEGVGELLFASHESSATNYENSTPELDFIVDWLADESSVLGARLTGAGFGGAVMAWTRNRFSAVRAKDVKEAYASRFGESIEILSCTPTQGSFARSFG